MEGRRTAMTGTGLRASEIATVAGCGLFGLVLLAAGIANAFHAFGAEVDGAVVNLLRGGCFLLGAISLLIGLANWYHARLRRAVAANPEKFLEEHPAPALVRDDPDLAQLLAKAGEVCRRMSASRARVSDLLLAVRVLTREYDPAGGYYRREAQRLSALADEILGPVEGGG